MMNFLIISANHTSYKLISRPLVTPKTFRHTANITVRKLLVVPIQNFKYVYDDVGNRIFNLTTSKITVIQLVVMGEK